MLQLAAGILIAALPIKIIRFGFATLSAPENGYRADNESAHSILLGVGRAIAAAIIGAAYFYPA